MGYFITVNEIIYMDGVTIAFTKYIRQELIVSDVLHLGS